MSMSEQISDTRSHVNEWYVDIPEKKEKLQSWKWGTIATTKYRAVHLRTRREHWQWLALWPPWHEGWEGHWPGLSWRKLCKVFEQLHAKTTKEFRQVCWHPLIIQWWLNLKLLSSSAYHATRTAGFIKLPSERTLSDYTHIISKSPRIPRIPPLSESAAHQGRETGQFTWTP